MDFDMNFSDSDIAELSKLAGVPSKDVREALWLVRLVCLFFFALNKIFEEVEMGYKLPTPPRPLQTPAKRMPCLGPYCKNTTSSKTGYCSFDCEDWGRILAKGTKKQCQRLKV